MSGHRVKRGIITAVMAAVLLCLAGLSPAAAADNAVYTYISLLPGDDGSVHRLVRQYSGRVLAQYEIDESLIGEHAGTHLIAFTFSASLFAAGSVSAAACDAKEHRAFDFWIGEWEVRRPDGKLTGINRIEQKHGGCVLHERYTTEHGYGGESLNIYDAPRKLWHQTWVDTAGTLLLLEGGLRNGNMVLEGQTLGADAQPARHRITWTPNPDGSVRQHWETTDAEGQWETVFNGLYTRKTN